jgi:hypothetical protein
MGAAPARIRTLMRHRFAADYLCVRRKRLPASGGAQAAIERKRRTDERMITQYEAVAEIEAMKWKRMKTSRARVDAAGGGAGTEHWSSATERAIREEMERRLARRMPSGS